MIDPGMFFAAAGDLLVDARAGSRAGPCLQRRADPLGRDADETLAEGQYADHEDHAQDDREPGAESGQVILHRDDHQGAGEPEPRPKIVNGHRRQPGDCGAREGAAGLTARSRSTIIWDFTDRTTRNAG